MWNTKTAWTCNFYRVFLHLLGVTVTNLNPTPRTHPPHTNTDSADRMAATSTDVVDGWKSYFVNLTSFIKECKRHKETDSIEKATYFCETLERYIRSTDRLLATVMDHVDVPLLCPPVHHTDGVEILELALLLEKLVNVLKVFWLPYWRCREETLESAALSTCRLPELNDHIQIVHTGMDALCERVHSWQTV